MKNVIRIMSILLTCLLLNLSTVYAMDSSPQGMALLGQGEVRYLNLIKVYSAALYADQKEINQNRSRCLVLEYAVSLKPQDMIRAANKVLDEQYSEATIARFRAQIEALHNSYRKVNKGDKYSLCYNSDQQQTTLSLNNQLLVSIPSAEFAQLYFGIWLSDSAPIDRTLQRQLLQRSDSKEES